MMGRRDTIVFEVGLLIAGFLIAALIVACVL